MPPGAPPGRPYAPPGAVVAPNPLPAPIAPADDPANWTEHTMQDGKKYYHNKVSHYASLLTLDTLSVCPNPLLLLLLLNDTGDKD